MKRIGSMVCALLFVAFLLIPCVTAAEPSVFVDTLEDDYPLVFEKSDMMRYEKNADTGKTLYEKLSETGDYTTTEYVTYRFKESVMSFSIDCMHVNGLGDGNTDISVFVSKDNADWTEVPTYVTPQTYDEDLYVNEDMAYWRLSTVSNADPIEPGYKFLKVQINPFYVKGSVVWNTVMDTITVEYGEAEQEPAPEPAESAPEPEPPQPAETSAPEQPVQQSDNTNSILLICGAVVVASIGAVVVLLVRNKKG